jgi:hypothetical protein
MSRQYGPCHDPEVWLTKWTLGIENCRPRQAELLRGGQITYSSFVLLNHFNSFCFLRTFPVTFATHYDSLAVGNHGKPRKALYWVLLSGANNLTVKMTASLLLCIIMAWVLDLAAIALYFTFSRQFWAIVISIYGRSTPSSIHEALAFSMGIFGSLHAHLTARRVGFRSVFSLLQHIRSFDIFYMIANLAHHSQYT